MTIETQTLDETIDATISEAVEAEAQEVEATDAPVEEAQEAPKEEVAEEAVEEQAEATEEPEDVPFPKKAENAISRLKKDKSKLQAKLSEYDQKFADMEARLNAPQSEQDAPKAPVEDDYETYGEFMQAQQDYAIEQAQKAMAEKYGLKEQPKQEPLTPEQAQMQEWVNERSEHASEQFKAVMSDIPDMEGVINENIDILDSLEGTELERMALSLDNPMLAVYNLLKDGVDVNTLQQLPPAAAYSVIKEAHDKGYSKPNVVSKAPSPISSPSGSGAKVESDLASKSTSELLKWVNS